MTDEETSKEPQSDAERSAAPRRASGTQKMSTSEIIEQTPPRSGALKSHGRLSVSASMRPRDLMDEAPKLAGAWTAKIVTLFPEAFPGVLGLSLTGKALSEGLWALETIDLRPFGIGKHRNVDDTPAGGGAGMVLRADVVGAALEQARIGTPKDRARWPVIYMSPRGKPLTQAMAQRYSSAEGMTILCGRFEGVDERALEHYGVEEVSIGDFVLTGGEIAAQVLIDATVRLIPRVLGNQASTEEESFSHGLLEHPQYTKPALWEGREIPETLQSGHHAKIADWRRAMAERLTKERRPDLWRAWCEDHNRDPNEDREL
jgi:tRNA (guanine37-N1)-methyltransferase